MIGQWPVLESGATASPTGSAAFKPDVGFAQIQMTDFYIEQPAGFTGFVCFSTQPRFHYVYWTRVSICMFLTHSRPLLLMIDLTAGPISNAEVEI